MTENENLILENPSPNFDEFVLILKGEQEPHRVPLVEHQIDEDIIKLISEQYLGETYKTDTNIILRTDGIGEEQLRQHIQVYYRLGYDYVPLWSVWKNHPAPNASLAKDTAEISSGPRTWADEGYGLITSWEDFNKFPWDKIHADMSHFRYLSHLLPSGMKLVIFRAVFEHVLEVLLGYQGFFYKLYDDPSLVEAIFEQWGQKVFDYYSAAIKLDTVGAIFHCDDLGYKTSSMISPKWLRKLFFPWLKKYVQLAHDQNKPFWLHSCGNLYTQGIMEELIENVQIDGFHSFQDQILPVYEFKARYGNRVATLGGIDMDNLVRMDEESLRLYMRHILDNCMPQGRYAFGSGNTIANYIPIKNFAILLDEARRWHPKS